MDDDQGPSNAYLEALKACQAESDPATRLACFDTAAESMVGASEAGELKLVDREEVRKTRRKLFGFSLPDFGIFGKGDDHREDEDEFSQMETTIASVSGSHSTGYTLRTAEGAVWRLDDVPGRLLEPRKGDTLLIKSGALSSYFLRINNQRGIKGSRIR
ncbi:hypothetical protein [Erythrobacter aureus]|uniref:hypothetical protein n=1 Tax=Erythrobacter aureus TaxID=2182384 RepID=UPI003A952131